MIQRLQAGLLSAALLIAPAAASAQPASAVFNNPIPNIPGKSLVAVVVSYAPGGKSPPHRHAHSAFITAYVLSGAIRSQVDGGETKVFTAGQSFTENPGQHHTIGENASMTEPAKLMAIFVVDTAESAALTTFDK
jgi:quercetin dioxygenase-like cupin family protein